MPVRFEMIQFVCHFPSQLEPAKETVRGAFLCDQALCIHNSQYQPPFRLLQHFDQCLVAFFHFLFLF